MTEHHAWGNDRILTFTKEARELYKALYKGDPSVAIPAPRFISCWVSEVCNLDCTYCFFSSTNHDKSHQFIAVDPFLAWLKQAREAGTEALEFSGGGEPTLHPEFKLISMRANEMGLKLGLITHACNKMPLETIVRDFSYVRCGLDAATTETHDLIKRNNRKGFWFPQALANIKEMVRCRDLYNPDAFTVGIKVVLNTINFHELQQMIDLARELRVNYIQIKQEHSSDHPLSVEQCLQAQEIIEDCGMDSHPTKVKGTMHHQRATTKCFMSPIHTVITATGKILQCCFFEKRPIGTIFQPFSEVWGGPEHRKVVDMTTVSECDKVDCRWNYYNRVMQEVIEDPLGKVSFI